MGLNLILSLSRVERVSVSEREQVVHIGVSNVITETISRGNSYKVDVGLSTGVSSENAISKSRNVDACIALTTKK